MRLARAYWDRTVFPLGALSRRNLRLCCIGDDATHIRSQRSASQLLDDRPHAFFDLLEVVVASSGSISQTATSSSGPIQRPSVPDPPSTFLPGRELERPEQGPWEPSKSERRSGDVGANRVSEQAANLSGCVACHFACSYLAAHQAVRNVSSRTTTRYARLR